MLRDLTGMLSALDLTLDDVNVHKWSPLNDVIFWAYCCHGLSSDIGSHIHFWLRDVIYRRPIRVSKWTFGHEIHPRKNVSRYPCCFIIGTRLLIKKTVCFNLPFLNLLQFIENFKYWKRFSIHYYKHQCCKNAYLSFCSRNKFKVLYLKKK